MICPRCQGAMLVCENHPDLAWPNQCDCGAGMPCPVCCRASPELIVGRRAKAVQRAVEAMTRPRVGRR
jgi:hypothetical protein